MPLKGSRSKKFSEFRHGKKFKAMKKKFGKARANKIMQAAVLHSSGPTR